MIARFVATAAAALFAAGAAAQQVSLGTSAAGSIYHQTGSVIAKLLNEKGGLPTTIQPFASPNVFIPAINAGEIQLGMANIAEVSYALEGTEHFKGRANRELRVVAVAFPLRSTVFVRKDSPIRSFADLKGRPAVDGFTSQRIILPLLDAMYATAGMTRNDVQRVQVPTVVVGADLFAAGKTDMFFFAIGAPKPREVDAAVGGIRMLSLPNTPEALAAIRKHYPHGYLRLEKPGPGSVGVLYNMIPGAEQHIDFIADTIAFLDREGYASVEPGEEAEKAWCAHVDEVADQSVYPKANTWYMGDNVPGKPREFLAYAGGGPAYFAHFTRAAAEGYPEFVLRRP